MPEIVLENELEKLRKFNQNLEWFQDNYETLKQQFKGEFVAIKDEKVIDNDKDYIKLINKLKSKYDDIKTIVVEQVNENKYIYAM